MTEDQVRSQAADILGFSNPADNISGVGQLTTFNNLGFRGVSDKPDGWYLPANKSEVAIILEVKRSSANISSPNCIAEILKNIKIAKRKYRRVVGILYNGDDVLVYKNETRVATIHALQCKEYYLGLWEINKIDKQKIYRLTKQINDNLHFNFKVKNLYHRMIVTACALVAEKHGATLSRVKDLGWDTFQTRIKTTLEQSFASAVLQNEKLKLLLKTFEQIEVHFADQNAINNFIDCVGEISNSINSDYWNGEDVMAIFFNEFNRYKGKSESGQVFTPDHVTSLMYRLIEVNKDDVVLDAACGSGAFLVKAMCNMIKEAGGAATQKAREIKADQLYGIENDAQIYALACANMLIHKDGKTNLAFLDSRTEEAARWIRSKPITKVLMNPPFERKYGCLKIVKNVLDNVTANTLCAFIMPDTKLDKGNGRRLLLRNHTLLKIVKLPEKVFNEGVVTSVFVFKAGVPHGNRDIFACYIEDDGLVTVKNQGRQDVNNTWKEIEDGWINIIHRQSGNNTIQWLKPDEHLSWQVPLPPFSVSEMDFFKTAMDYVMFKSGVSPKDLLGGISSALIYSSFEEGKNAVDALTAMAGIKSVKNLSIDNVTWKRVKAADVFITEAFGSGRQVPTGASVPRGVLVDGSTPRVTVTGENNGIFGSYDCLRPDQNYRKYKNFISVSFLGTVFYHSNECTLDMKVHCLKPQTFSLDEETGMFFVTIIKKCLTRGSYADQISSSLLPELELELPVDGCGNIDIEFMRCYGHKILKESERRLRIIRNAVGMI